MLPTDRPCPDCELPNESFSRRNFLRSASAGFAAGAAAIASGSLLAGIAAAAPSPKDKSETLVKTLFEGLSEKQKKVVCFPWDFQDKTRGLLRTHICNNWEITPPHVKSDFFTSEQQALVRSIWEGLVNPDWIERFDRRGITPPTLARVPEGCLAASHRRRRWWFSSLQLRALESNHCFESHNLHV